MLSGDIQGNSLRQNSMHAAQHFEHYHQTSIKKWICCVFADDE